MKKLHVLIGIAFLLTPAITNAQVSAASYVALQARVITLENQVAALTALVQSIQVQKGIVAASAPIPSLSINSQAKDITSVTPASISRSDVMKGEDIYVSVGGPKINNTSNSKVLISAYINNEPAGCSLTNLGSPVVPWFNTSNCTSIPIAYYGLTTVTFKLPKYLPSQIPDSYVLIVVTSKGQSVLTIPII